MKKAFLICNNKTNNAKFTAFCVDGDGGRFLAAAFVTIINAKYVSMLIV